MVEPLEETRGELIFATEPVLSSLEHSIPSSGRHASVVELDEVEVSFVPTEAISTTEADFICWLIDPEGHSATVQRTFILAFLGPVST